MPFIIADRVRETSTTVGTGSIALGGAVVGYQSFDAALDTNDTTFYVFADQAGGPNWEVGIGTFTAPSTLARTTIISSSNGGSIVNFGSGTKDVFISLPASKTNVDDQPNVIEVNSSSAALRITQTGAGNALLVEDSANPDSSPFVIDASGNVGVGTTTPTAPLDVNGNVAITGTARRITGDFSNATFASRVAFQTSTTNASTTLSVIPNGTNTQSDFFAYNSSDPNNASVLLMRAGTAETSIRSANTGTGTLLPMAFNTGGAERMRITTAGLLGLGTSSPITKMTIADPVEAGTRYLGNGLTSAGLFVGYNGAAFVYNDSNTPMIFGTNAAERMRIDTAGNVGIGTNAPGTKLDIYDPASAGNPAVRIRDNVSDLRLYPSGGGSYVATISNTPLIFNTNNTERMRISAAGGVGIGVSSPSYPLDIQADAAAFGWTIRGRSADNISVGRFATNANVDTARLIAFGDGTFAISNTSSATERMRIDPVGNVGIGNSAPAARLDVVAASGVQISASNGSISQRVGYCGFGSVFSGSASNNPYVLLVNDTERMRIAANGNVGIGTSAPNAKLDLYTNAAVGVAMNAGNSLNTWSFGVDSSGNSGIYSNGAYNIIFSTAATERMRVSAAGNVGIGTSNPNYRLEVYTSNTNGTDGLAVFGGATATRTIEIRPSMGAGNNNGIVQAGDSGIIFSASAINSGAFVIAPWNSTTSGIRIDGSNGNVGIAVASPAARLHVAGTIQSQNGSSFAQMYSDGGAAYFTSVGAFPSLFLTNGSERMRISGSAADVAIGTSSFYYASANRSTMTIVGATDALLALGGGGAASGYVYGSAATMNLTADSRTLSLQATGSNIIQFITGVSERMRLDASGNLGIGTSSPTSLLDVNGQMRVRGTRIFQDNSGGGSFEIGPGAGTGNASIWGFYAPASRTISLFTNATEQLRIDTSGNLQFNSGYGSPSTAFGCRAWVNFNGTGTVAIRASGNVSSITDLGGSGVYRVNFATAMPDANYSALVTGSTFSGNGAQVGRATNYATGSVDSDFGVPNVTSVDQTTVSVAIFR